MVLLSPDTARKQVAHHPELTAEEHTLLAALIAEPQLTLEQDTQRVLAPLRRCRIYVAAVKATEDASAAYAVSFRRLSEQDLRRMLRKYRVLHGDPSQMQALGEGGAARR